MIFALIEGLIRNISGSLGIFIRRGYYSFRLGKCGKKLVISEGVFFDKPKCIEIGDKVWIDRNSILIAGKNSVKHQIYGPYSENLAGRILIGSNVHIGIGTILQGHGGIKIGDYFTSSANCKIYSLSNDPLKCIKGTIVDDDYSAPSILGQVVVEDNVWLGLNVSVLGTQIGNNSFIKPNSVVTKPIAPNSIAEGAPAIKIKPRFEEGG